MASCGIAPPYHPVGNSHHSSYVIHVNVDIVSVDVEDEDQDDDNDDQFT